MDLVLPELEQLSTNYGRFYRTPEGNLYPSVTTVLGSTGDDTWLKEWRAKVGEDEANRVSSRASRRGTRIHKYAEDYITTGQVECESIFDQIVVNSLKPVFNRVSDVKVIEARLYSHILKSAGTVDLIANFDSTISIIDWKTSRNPKYKDQIHGYFIQASAYAVMFWELFKIPVRQIVIVIAVDMDQPQVYIEKVDHWVNEYKKLRNQFTYNEKEIIITP